MQPCVFDAWIAASCATQSTEDTTQDFFVNVFQDNIVIIQVVLWDGGLCSLRHLCRRGRPCGRGRFWHLQGEIAVMREPAIAVIMRPCKKKIILLRLVDVD